jgi:hypothetical protein
MACRLQLKPERESERIVRWGSQHAFSVRGAPASRAGSTRIGLVARALLLHFGVQALTGSHKP